MGMETAPVIPAETWVDAETVGKHIGFKSCHVRVLARSGQLPGTKMQNGKREFWRFKLSIIDKYLEESMNVGVVAR